MFETYEVARLPVLPSFGLSTTRWAFIAQSENREWFYVTHQYFQDGDSECVCTQQFLIPDVMGLMGLVHSDSDTAFVSGVQLVSPGWLNGTDEWRMETLSKLIVIPGEERSKYSYQVASGSTYPIPSADTQPVGKIIWPVR
ncbi:hypothetical protein ACQKP7_15805 [Pseudomonas frederiksbergensis]|uniref:hypothetical protein n=1 Tax=Pseudomonas TaxID=286 RepID=UPI0016465EB8|nr:hypothetical protein [Pseudomonas sp. SWRI99]MBC3776382.1 hypothetical protein [Pseudomonas sp. SWRI99]